MSTTSFARETAQRRAIRAVLKSAGRPLAPEETLEAAKTRVPGLGLATVYRTLKTMVSSGEVEVVELPGASARYETAGGHHHHYFRCRSCDRVYEIEGCLPGVKGLVPRGFRLESHEVFLEGTCSSCAA